MPMPFLPLPNLPLRLLLPPPLPVPAAVVAVVERMANAPTEMRNENVNDWKKKGD